MKVLVLTTGGTIFQRYDTESKQMKTNSVSLESLLSSISKESKLVYVIEQISERSGAHLNFEVIFRVRDAIVECEDKYDGFLLITGKIDL